MSARADELRRRLLQVQRRIESACRDAGRDPSSVTLVAVSKTWPVSDIAVLRDAGVRDFGENRLEELRGKSEQLADPGIRWHFLGQVQSKKASGVGRVADAVHSVDRAKLVRGLGDGAEQAGRILGVFLQVSLADLAPAGEAAGRGGAEPDAVAGLADAVAADPRLRLAGVMTLPPRSADPALAFARLAGISAELQHRHPAATGISAGMSHDFPEAIAAGATHVRVGSAVFGERYAVR